MCSFILYLFIHFTIRLRLKYSFHHVQLSTVFHIIITWIIMMVLAYFYFSSCFYYSKRYHIQKNKYFTIKIHLFFIFLYIEYCTVRWHQHNQTNSLSLSSDPWGHRFYLCKWLPSLALPKQGDIVDDVDAVLPFVPVDENIFPVHLKKIQAKQAKDRDLRQKIKTNPSHFQKTMVEQVKVVTTRIESMSPRICGQG